MALGRKGLNASKVELFSFLFLISNNTVKLKAPLLFGGHSPTLLVAKSKIAFVILCFVEMLF